VTGVTGLMAELKKKSLASTLRKRFGRGGGKDSVRAQSAERIPAAYYDSNLLRPPDSVDAARVSGNIELRRV